MADLRSGAGPWHTGRRSCSEARSARAAEGHRRRVRGEVRQGSVSRYGRGPKSAAKGAGKELARLEKRLQKARDVEAKRKKQASKRAEVAQLTAQVKALSPPQPAHDRWRRPAPAAAKPAAAKPAAATPKVAVTSSSSGVDDVGVTRRTASKPQRERRARGRRLQPTDRATALAHPDATSPANRSGRRAALGAAVDLGSNSVHLLVAAVDSHRLEPLVDESVFLGLGNAVHDGQPLGSAGRGRACRGACPVRGDGTSPGVADISLLGTEPLRRAADAAASSSTRPGWQPARRSMSSHMRKRRT